MTLDEFLESDHDGGTFHELTGLGIDPSRSTTYASIALEYSL